MQKRFPKAKRIIRKMEQITRPHFTIIASEELLIVSACTFVSQQTGDLTTGDKTICERMRNGENDVSGCV